MNGWFAEIRFRCLCEHPFRFFPLRFAFAVSVNEPLVFSFFQERTTSDFYVIPAGNEKMTLSTNLFDYVCILRVFISEVYDLQRKTNK